MGGERFAGDRRRGSAIILVVFAVVVLTALGTSLLRLGLGSRVKAIRNADEISARCGADAGLTKAVFLMNQKLEAQAWDDPTLPKATDEVLPNCDATFSYKINARSINSNKDFDIACTGRSGAAVKQISYFCHIY